MDNASQPNHACPHLGLNDDKSTSLGFPSNWNFCYQSDPIAPPHFKHQEEFCLSGRHNECPLFLSQQAGPLPQELRSPPSSADVARKNSRRNLVIALSVGVAVLLLGWGMLRRRLSSPEIGEVSQAVSPVVVSTFTLAPPPTVSLLLPNIQAITPTLTIVPSRHELEAPIGIEYKFVIHKVIDGEDLNLYAEKYNTSIEAITAVNYKSLSPLWTNTLVIIPLGFTDVEKLPSFEAYQVKEKDRGISVESLAERLKVTPLDLKYYNGWTSDGDRPLVGDVLLIPRLKSVQ